MAYYATLAPHASFYEDRSSEFEPLRSAAPAAAGADEEARKVILVAPLFLQGRGVAPPQQQAAAAPPPPAEPEPELRLVGIEMLDQSRLAIIQVSNQPKAVRATEGQPIGSWTVARIFTDHVELSRQTSTRSLYLGDTKPPIDGLLQ